MQWPYRFPIRRSYLHSTTGQYRVIPIKFSTIPAAQCVKATFFLVGEMARAQPLTVRRIFAEGHTIGTHSEDHPVRFGKLPPPLVEWEIDKGILDVGSALGDHRQVAPFFRVPGLARSDVIESELAARVLVDSGSDTAADDWHHRISPKKIIALAMNRLKARGKGILLLHDIHPATVAALPDLLKELRQRDFISSMWCQLRWINSSCSMQCPREAVVMLLACLEPAK